MTYSIPKLHAYLQIFIHILMNYTINKCLLLAKHHLVKNVLILLFRPSIFITVKYHKRHPASI